MVGVYVGLRSGMRLREAIRGPPSRDTLRERQRRGSLWSEAVVMSRGRAFLPRNTEITERHGELRQCGDADGLRGLRIGTRNEPGFFFTAAQEAKRNPPGGCEKEFVRAPPLFPR